MRHPSSHNCILSLAASTVLYRPSPVHRCRSKSQLLPHHDPSHLKSAKTPENTTQKEIRGVSPQKVETGRVSRAGEVRPNGKASMRSTGLGTTVIRPAVRFLLGAEA